MTQAALDFLPHAFFWRPWVGHGKVYSAAGKPLGDFRAEGEGETVGDAAHMRHRITHQGGVETLDWVLLSDDPARYRAEERTLGYIARGRRRGGEFQWSFWSRMPTPLGRQPVRVVATYCMEGPGRAASSATTWLWGLIPILRVNAAYSHRA